MISSIYKTNHNHIEISIILSTSRKTKKRIDYYERVKERQVRFRGGRSCLYVKNNRKEERKWLRSIYSKKIRYYIRFKAYKKCMIVT